MRPAVRSGRCSPRTGWRRGRRTLVGASSSSPPAADHVFDTLGATWWIDAAQEPQDRSGVQWALNRGSTSVPHARLGSTGRAELRGSYGLVLPGVTSNMAYVPAVALTNATVAIQFKQPLSTMLTGLGANTVAGRGTISGGAFSDWGVTLGGSALGGNSWMMSGLGASGWSGSAIPLAIRDAADVWYRWSRDDATGNVTCHYSTDGTSWTAVGSLTSAAGALTSANGYFLVGGSVYNSMTTAMTVRRMVISSSGTTVFDADFTTASAFATSFTESSSNAATVTINATSGADTNDPLLLPHTGTNYLYTSGVNGNYASAADSTALGITGDIDLRCRVALDDWTPSADSAFITKDSSTREYAFGVNATGATLYFYWWNAGGTFTQVNSSVAPTVSDGAALDVRVTLDVDNGSSTREVRFWTKDTTAPLSDNSGWTQLGTTSSAAGVSSIRDTADTVGIGARLGGNASAGKFYRAMILNGIGGTTVFDADFTANTNQSSFTESSSNAATVTINRATSGRKAVMVTRPVWLFGTDDYMEVADNALLDMAAADSFTAVLVMRRWGNGYTSGAGVGISKESGVATVGWSFNYDGGNDNAFIHDGSVSSVKAKAWPTAGTMSLISIIRNVAGDTIGMAAGSTIVTATDTTTASLANSQVMQVGRLSGTAYYGDFELVAVAVFRSALSSSDLADIASYFGV